VVCYIGVIELMCKGNGICLNYGVILSSVSAALFFTAFCFSVVAHEFPLSTMSSLSIVIAIALLLAVVAWLTGYRLPITRPPSSLGSGGHLRAQRGVAKATRKRLLGLVGGNAAIAQRLVVDVQRRNPGRTEQWCWEKAIYDVERDRRA
jgi:hypothetical protein